VATIILSVLLLLSIGGNLVQQFVQGVLLSQRPTYRGSRHEMLQEVMVENHGSRHKIAVIELTGIITGDPLDRSGLSLVEYVRDQLTRAALDERVKAVLLKIDSPGGEVLASDTIARDIREFQQKHSKPVIASMASVAASGGYYIAVPCRWIVANELTLTGSIGVILSSFNYRGLMDKIGVRPVIYKSGRFKDMLSPFRQEQEIPEEEREMMQQLIDETFTRFKEVVQTGRQATATETANPGRPLTENWEQYADGRILSGRQAFDYGFVDELGDFESATSRAEKLAGIPDANLIRYQRPFGLGSLFSLVGETESRAVKIDLGVEPPRLELGRMYFLSPALIQ
jgi:protease-4